VAPCLACGFENAESAKFCSECGAQLGASATLPRREERKVVSVVFVDLVGSTARAESSDPEDVRALLRVYHERAREELERHGGTVEKFIGDAVVAVFGAPVAHEDDAERAVRAALAVRDAVALLNEEVPDRDLHVRIAVNTGEALVSLHASPDEGEGMVAGDVMNTAARLQSAAPVDGILVGEQTYRATDREIVYRDASPVEAKGKSEAIAVWEAVEARARFGVDVGGAGRAELVGRDTERELLASALSRSRRERSTQLVTLVGVPGIGKSRLVYELSRIVDADEELITWRQGRSLAYGEGVSYWALGEIVKAQAGILESDTAAETERKLADAVAPLADGQERAWVERHLRPLVGLGGDDASGDRRGEAFAAWRRYLESLAEAGPTVLVFEDLHWADDGLLDFVDNLVDWVDGVPLLVVGTARPELLDRRPGWGGGKRNATTISLASLDDAATARLVLALLDRAVLDADVQQALVERAAGNPLYAEEFVRMLEAGGTTDGTLPDSVQGIVAARIDLLPAREKELLQNASVLGKVVWSDALLELSGGSQWELTETLHALERKEFIRREHRSAVAGALQYAFVHALVRDAAYGQLPRATRAERHLAVASWIESLPEDRAEDRAETLAHHYLTAIDLYRAAGGDISALAPRAVPALREAGERALLLGAFRTAAAFLERALEFIPAEEEPAPELLLAAGTAFGYVGRTGDELARAVEAFEHSGDVERAAEAAIWAYRHGWHAGSEETYAWLERAARLVDDRPVSRAKALVVSEQARRAMLAYRPETGRDLAERAVALARELGEVEIEAHGLVTLGCSRVSVGDSAGVHDLEAAFERVGGRGLAAGRALTNLGWAYEVIGDSRRSHEASREAVALGEREGDLQSAWFARGNLAQSAYDLGEWDEALELVDSFGAAPEGARYQQALIGSVRAQILTARDRADEALAVMREILEFVTSQGDPQVAWSQLAEYSRLALRCGLREEAEARLDELAEAIAAHESVGDPLRWHVEYVLALCDLDRNAQARVIVGRLAAGTWRTACETIVGGEHGRAADLLEATGDKPLQAELRLRAAADLAAEGRLTEAHAQLERARAFWTSVGATAYLREADAVLAAAS
jgi:class 3 adenylate cyclase/tetratricopeptide (TPR) repeat protein